MTVGNSSTTAKWMSAAIICFVMTVLAASIASCTSIDCPLNNTVQARFVLKGDVDTLKDTVTISAIRTDGKNNVVFNKGVNLTTFAIPLSYIQETDRFAVLFKSSEGTIWKDTIALSKTNQPHFESVECGPNYFHTLTNISSTTRYIQDIIINNPNVDYNEKREHIYLYLRTHD